MAASDTIASMATSHPFSPDGNWWWSGEAWVPVQSKDKRWRWTGVCWQRVRRLVWAPWMTVVAVLWFLALGAWVPAVGLTNAIAKATAPVVGSLAVSGGIALGMTVVVGFLLGRRGWWRHLGLAVLGGTGALLFWYVVAMIAFADPNDPTADNAAAVGVIIFAIPTLLIIALLLGVGAGLGRLSRRFGYPSG